MAAPDFENGRVLNSWKEIANHVGRGVRTVQRWERDLGMPVRRPRAKSRSAVIALVDEIDAWLRSAPTAELIPHHAGPSQVLDQLHRSLADHLELRDRCNRLREANHQAIAALMASIKLMQELMQQNAEQNRDAWPEFSQVTKQK